MKIAAIPTMYAGVQFRSRLEARWAAFFDLMSWQWEYEPFDLPGWIPDFLLTYQGRGDVLVEVKPARSLEEIAPHAEDLAAFCDSRWILVLGAGPMQEVGYLRRTFSPTADHVALLLEWMMDPTVALGAAWDPTRKLWTQATMETPRWVEASAAWKEAGNLVQYKSPRSRR